jgi:hypothetical protein
VTVILILPMGDFVDEKDALLNYYHAPNLYKWSTASKCMTSNSGKRLHFCILQETIFFLAKRGKSKASTSVLVDSL